MYLNSINYFRAIAIIFIVASHCFYLSDYTFTSDFGNVINNITGGGTSFFVFISGFLFHHVFYKNFDFSKFMKNKIKFVLSPYLIMSFLPLIFYVFLDDNIWEYFKPKGDGVLDLYFIPFIKYYTTGFRIVAYWYIPFAMIIFLMSPIFISFIRLNLKFQFLIIFPLLIISTLIYRPVENSGYAVVQSVAYFLPVYLIGIVSSQKKDFIYFNLKGKEVYLLGIGLLLATIPLFFGQVGLLRKDPFSYEGFDLMIIQKIVFCFLFMVWLDRFENDKNKFINLISENSFGIFFIHPLLLMAFAKIKNLLDFTFPLNVYFIYIIVSIMIFSLSLGFTLLVKRVFPVHSRSIIGS